MSVVGKWIRSIVALRRDDEGAAAVEFALTLPMYLATIFFLVEMTRIAYTQGVVVHAAEQATRYALVHYDATTDEIQEEARSSLIGLSADNLTAIVVTAPTDPTDQTKLVTVEVRYNYTPILPFIAFLPIEGDGSIPLYGASKGFITEEIPTL
jgi:Flp pilus assembly protein TadG